MWRHCHSSLLHKHLELVRIRCRLGHGECVFLQIRPLLCLRDDHHVSLAARAHLTRSAREHRLSDPIQVHQDHVVQNVNTGRNSHVQLFGQSPIASQHRPRGDPDGRQSER